MSKAGSFLAFVAGAAIGGATAWYVVKDIYSQRADQEIESSKNAFRKREKKLSDEIEALKQQLADRNEENTQTVLAPNKTKEKENIAEYVRRVRGEEGYTEYSRTVVPPKPEKENLDEDTPYVIPPEEFDGEEGYTLVSLTYYADGVLADENGVVIENAEEIVGDALEHFGEYEDDSVYCRSDLKRCDYEILKDLRKYEDIRKNLPPNI